MIVSVDTVDWHAHSVTDAMSEEELWERTAAHIGYFIEWAYKRGFAPADIEDDESAEIQKVIDAENTGVQYLMDFRDGVFCDDCLNEAGAQFAAYAYEGYIGHDEEMIGHEPYIGTHNQADQQIVFTYLDVRYAQFQTALQADTGGLWRRVLDFVRP